MTEVATLPDRVVDYIARGPTDLGSIARHFGMTPSETMPLLLEMQHAGRIRCERYYLWEVSP